MFGNRVINSIKNYTGGVIRPFKTIRMLILIFGRAVLADTCPIILIKLLKLVGRALHIDPHTERMDRIRPTHNMANKIWDLLAYYEYRHYECRSLVSHIK